MVGERTNANGSKKFREAMLAGDWDTCVAMARDQIKEGSHVLDVCVDYTGADGVADMNEIASRLATQSPVPLDGRHHRDPRRQAGAAPGSAGGPSSTRSTSRRATGPAPASTASSARRASSAPPSCAPVSTRRARRARPTGRSAPPGPSTTSPSTATGSSRPTSSSTPWRCRSRRAWRRAGATGSRPSRRSGGSRPSSRGAHDPRALQRLLRPEPGGAAGAQLASSCTSASRPGSTRPSSTRRRSCRSRASTTRPAEVCLDLIYDRRREGYDPLHGAARPLRRCLAVDVARHEDRTDWPVERRLEQRIVDGDRNGLESDLDEALAGGHRGARHRQRHPARRHEDGRRALRLRRDAAAVRAADRPRR